jgi:hypothetical protein
MDKRLWQKIFLFLYISGSASCGPARPWGEAAPSPTLPPAVLPPPAKVSPIAELGLRLLPESVVGGTPGTRNPSFDESDYFKDSIASDYEVFIKRTVFLRDKTSSDTNQRRELFLVWP